MTRGSHHIPRTLTRRGYLAIQAGWVLLAGTGAFLSGVEGSMAWTWLVAAGVFGSMAWPGWDAPSREGVR